MCWQLYPIPKAIKLNKLKNKKNININAEKKNKLKPTPNLNKLDVGNNQGDY